LPLWLNFSRLGLLNQTFLNTSNLYHIKMDDRALVNLCADLLVIYHAAKHGATNVLASLLVIRRVSTDVRLIQSYEVAHKNSRSLLNIEI
jgi:hypothetical protein